MSESVFYEIQIEARLDGHWSAWFDDLALSHGADNTTFLCGPLADQAALHGLLGKVRDLGLALVSVRRIAPPDRRGPQAAVAAAGQTS
jgi:hypothetical protein